MSVKTSRRCCLILLFLSCQVCAQEKSLSDMRVSGELIYGLANRLSSVSLTTGEKRLITTRKGGALQSGMTRISSDKLLIGGSGDLVEYDRNTGSLRTVGKGAYPLALPTRGIVFFYDARPGERQKLFKSPLQTPAIDLVEVEAGPYATAQPLIAISEDEIVFLGGDRQTIWRYNVTKSNLHKLPISECIPHAWRSRTNQLLCWGGKLKSYYLTDLDGRARKPISQLGAAIPVLYVDEFDGLIINEPSAWLPPERYALRMYHFEMNIKSNLADDALVARGTAVWLPSK